MQSFTQTMPRGRRHRLYRRIKILEKCVQMCEFIGRIPSDGPVYSVVCDAFGEVVAEVSKDDRFYSCPKCADMRTRLDEIIGSVGQMKGAKSVSTFCLALE